MAQFPTREPEIAAVAAAAAAEQATTTKDEALEGLTDAMKADLRYAENTVDFDDDKLKLLGWAGRKAGTSLEPPGQARTLEAPREGEGWIFLDWKEPVDGGKVEIERRERPEGPWSIGGIAMETEATLTSQERGKEFEYRVIAVNKAGEGVPSNSVISFVGLEIKKALLGSLALFVGGMIYVVWRGQNLVMFAWFDTLGLSDSVARLRDYAAPYSRVLPHWFYYCLPQALWFFSGLLLLSCIWRGAGTREGVAWVAVFFIIGSAFESGQLLGLVPGYFDAGDTVLLAIAALCAAWVSGVRWHKERRSPA